MLLSLVQGNCTLRPSGSLESVIAITLTQIIKLKLGAQKIKRASPNEKEKGRERERRKEKLRKSRMKSYTTIAVRHCVAFIISLAQKESHCQSACF